MATTRSKFAHAKVLVAALAVGMGLAAAPPAEAVPAKTAVVFDVKFANGTYVPAGVNVRLDRPWGIIAWGQDRSWGRRHLLQPAGRMDLHSLGLRHHSMRSAVRKTWEPPWRANGGKTATVTPVAIEGLIEPAAREVSS
jgi:hypothetical protein